MYNVYCIIYNVGLVSTEYCVSEWKRGGLHSEKGLSKKILS